MKKEKKTNLLLVKMLPWFCSKHISPYTENQPFSDFNPFNKFLLKWYLFIDEINMV